MSFQNDNLKAVSYGFQKKSIYKHCTFLLFVLSTKVAFVFCSAACWCPQSKIPCTPLTPNNSNKSGLEMWNGSIFWATNGNGNENNNMGI